MFKKCKIVMLPTDKSRLFTRDGKLEYAFTGGLLGNDPPTWLTYHLYILSDDEIKEDDYEYIWASNIIIKNNGSKNMGKKIIATTDSSLTYLHSFGAVAYHNQSYPSVPQSFISLYIEEYNKGNAPVDVAVEYEEDGYTINKSFPTSVRTDLKLKTDSNNHISIRRIKENWTREELKKAAIRFHFDLMLTRDNVSKITVEGWFDKWLDQHI